MAIDTLAVFSSLNSLVDVSQGAEYATMFGYDGEGAVATQHGNDGVGAVATHGAKWGTGPI